ncbi:MAG TPA: carotenoid oxygenase family protein [Myxococcota bacterium]|nr:carotenoid oxygenase family protein [Myxococcota bacterium]
MPKSPFLEGNFAPVERELAVDALAVIGELPSELEGSFIRNGPNPQFPPLGRYHWHDGDGMLHAVRLRGGRASYQNRAIETRAFELEKRRGRALWSGVLERPQFDHPEGATKNTANTGLVAHAGRLLALYEQGEPYEIRPDDLETLGTYSFGRRLRHPLSPHPKIDPVTGEMFAFGYSPVAKPHLQYSVIGREGALAHTTALELPIGVLMHDFGLSERFAIFMNHPYTFDVRRWLRGEPIARFEPERGSHLGVLPRRGSGSDVRWLSIAPCFAYHVANAWEDGEQVVLDVMQRASLDRNEDVEPGHSPPQPARLWRWRMDLARGSVREQQLDDQNVELPSVNPARVGRRARYVFASRMRDDVRLPLAEGLLKYDLARGVSSQLHRFGPNRNGGEGVFVPRPGAHDEDDGWLLAFVHDEAEGRSEFLIIDARDLTAPPVARVLLPQRVPYGFHGRWLPEFRG